MFACHQVRRHVKACGDRHYCPLDRISAPIKVCCFLPTCISSRLSSASGPLPSPPFHHCFTIRTNLFPVEGCCVKSFLLLYQCCFLPMFSGHLYPRGLLPACCCIRNPPLTSSSCLWHHHGAYHVISFTCVDHFRCGGARLLRSATRSHMGRAASEADRLLLPHHTGGAHAAGKKRKEKIQAMACY